MIGTCPKCGNYNWDKEVTDSRITCPACGHSWHFRKLPLFILTGCSGVGKTTTGQALQQRGLDLVVLDSDIFQRVMPLKTDADYQKQVEHIQRFSANIMQCGRPVLWTMAGNLNKLNNTYHRRFFSDIYCLALVCQESELRRRMTEGRKITDPDWIQSSVDYNRYFQTHRAVDDMPFSVLDITGKSVSEAADAVIEWHNKFTPYFVKNSGCF